MGWLPMLVSALLSIAILSSAQSIPDGQSSARQPQAQGYWVDPSTSLMWTAKDNGKDINGHKAIKYCRNLHLAGYSDWRLPNMAEIQGIFDKNVNAPGSAGYYKKLRPFTWHVKGNLFLTGDQWTSNYREDDRGHNSGYSWYFDFNEGRPNDEPTGWPYSSAGMRALCVRGQTDH